MGIEIKCTQEQREKLELLINNLDEAIEWNIIEMGSITDKEIDAFGEFSEHQKEIIKKAYSNYPKGFFPNPVCALF